MQHFNLLPKKQTAEESIFLNVFVHFLYSVAIYRTSFQLLTCNFFFFRHIENVRCSLKKLHRAILFCSLHECVSFIHDGRSFISPRSCLLSFLSFFGFAVYRSGEIQIWKIFYLKTCVCVLVLIPQHILSIIAFLHQPFNLHFWCLNCAKE